MITNKMLTTMLLLASLTLLLGACSGTYNPPSPGCASGIERQPGNISSGQMAGDPTIATLGTDAIDFHPGDTVHLTFTVTNPLDERIVLDGGQQPVLDICVPPIPCLSHYQADVAQLTHLVLEPGQSCTICWDWPPPDADLSNSRLDQPNPWFAEGKSILLDGELGTVSVPLGPGRP